MMVPLILVLALFPLLICILSDLSLAVDPSAGPIQLADPAAVLKLCAFLGDYMSAADTLDFACALCAMVYCPLLFHAQVVMLYAACKVAFKSVSPWIRLLAQGLATVFVFASKALWKAFSILATSSPLRSYWVRAISSKSLEATVVHVGPHSTPTSVRVVTSLPATEPVPVKVAPPTKSSPLDAPAPVDIPAPVAVSAPANVPVVPVDVPRTVPIPTSIDVPTPASVPALVAASASIRKTPNPIDDTIPVSKPQQVISSLVVASMTQADLSSTAQASLAVASTQVLRSAPTVGRAQATSVFPRAPLAILPPPTGSCFPEDALRTGSYFPADDPRTGSCCPEDEIRRPSSSLAFHTSDMVKIGAFLAKNFGVFAATLFPLQVIKDDPYDIAPLSDTAPVPAPRIFTRLNLFILPKNRPIHDLDVFFEIVAENKAHFVFAIRDKDGTIRRVGVLIHALTANVWRVEEPVCRWRCDTPLAARLDDDAYIARRWVKRWEKEFRAYLKKHGIKKRAKEVETMWDELTGQGAQ